MANNLFENGIDYSKKTEERKYHLPLEETGGVYIYVTLEEFKKYMDTISEEKADHDYLTRCLKPGERKSFIICRHKCEECPFYNGWTSPYQNRLTKSLDEATETRGVEASSDDDIVADLYIKERKAKVEKEVSLLSKYQQDLLELWKNDYTLVEIAEKLGVSKSKVDRDLKAAIDLLKEKCKDF